MWYDLLMNEVTLSLTTHDLPSALSKNGRRRTHWKQQMALTKTARDKARWIILVDYSGQELPKFENAHIHILEKWSNNPHDYDGLASLVAPAVDAFTDLEIIPDDSPRYIRSYTMTHEKVAKRAEAGVEIRVVRA